MADADQMADVLDPFEAAARRVRQGVRPEAGRQAGVATHVIENYLPYALGKAASLPQRATEAAGMLQRQGDVYDPAPALETAQMMMGRTPFPEPGSAGIFGGMLAKTADIPALREAGKIGGAWGDRLNAAGGKNLTAAERASFYDSANKDMWDNTGWYLGAESKPRFEIPDASSRLRKDMVDYHYSDPKSNIPLGSMLDHPALYEAYPSLKGYRIRSHPEKSGYYASFDNAGGFDLSHAVPQNELRKILLHEVQHGIQKIEDFAPGGSPTTIEGKYLVANPHNLDIKNIPLETSMKIEDASHKAYEQHAGEVESRNAEIRRNASPAQLRANNPMRTQDTPLHDQLFPHYWWTRQPQHVQNYVKALMGLK